MRLSRANPFHCLGVGMIPTLIVVAIVLWLTH
jgi:hypothetical protein